MAEIIKGDEVLLILAKLFNIEGHIRRIKIDAQYNDIAIAEIEFVIDEQFIERAKKAGLKP